jgi:hypothetical protein
MGINPEQVVYPMQDSLCRNEYLKPPLDHKPAIRSIFEVSTVLSAVAWQI